MAAAGNDKFNSEINVTPMVDIMLVLLIIFMVITPLLQSGVSVALPKDMKNPEEDKAIIKESSLVVAITKDNEYYVSKDKVEIGDIKDRVTRAMENKKPEERIVYIKSDVEANYGSVVEVINSIRQAGIDQIGLVADKKKGAGGAAAPAATTPAG
ncbi:MAG: biopolymer transporter ExbD [Acidobacteria bacterium]|nr:biopolymer transporter ExbD [Acidobacteriota bacterium]MCA1641466.1 biopolymer transporter ExbD [Acidobacteriota bacterium]